MKFPGIFQKKNSGEIARNRLKLLLLSERAGCSPEVLEMVKGDFVRAVSRYMEVDPSGVVLFVSRAGAAEWGVAPPALLAGIPLRGLRQ